MPLSTTDLPTLGEILKDSPGWLDEAVDTADARPNWREMKASGNWNWSTPLTD